MWPKKPKLFGDELKIPGYSLPKVPKIDNPVKVKKFKFKKLESMLKTPKVPKV